MQVTDQTADKHTVLSAAMPYRKYALSRAWISAIKKDASGTPKDGWKYTIRRQLRDIGLSGDEISIMIYALGYTSETDTEAFLKAISKSNLTTAQLKVIAELFDLRLSGNRLIA